MLDYDRIDISEGIDVVIFVIIGTLKILALSMNHNFIMVVMVYAKSYEF